jgi:hypothetical protein
MYVILAMRYLRGPLVVIALNVHLNPFRLSDGLPEKGAIG